MSKNIYNEDTSNKQYNFENSYENSDDDSEINSVIEYEEHEIYYEDTIIW